MGVCRFLAVVAVSCLVANTGRTQTYSLIEQPQTGDCLAIEIAMKLNGDMIVVQEGKQSKLRVTATAEHKFREKIMTVEPTRLIAKTARYYQTAKSTVSVDNAPMTRTLRPDRSLVVAQRNNDAFMAYAVNGPFTPEELETVGGHFDTLTLPGLLPQKEAKINETWKITPAVAQGLCLFEGLIAHEMTAKLAEVKGNVAVIAIEGSAKGIDVGAQASVTISGTARFDLAKKMLVGLEWKQQDQRDQGPASPAMKSDVVVTLSRTPIEEPKELSATALESVPQGFNVPEKMSALLFRDPRFRFELSLPREWHVVGQTDQHTVMRLLDRGDFVAQVTITPWEKAAASDHISAEKFKELMLSSPGWQAENVLQDGEVQSKPGRWCYRVSASGTMDDVKVVQTFFVVAGPQGDQVVFAFTMQQKQVNNLGVRDVTLVEGLRLPEKK